MIALDKCVTISVIVRTQWTKNGFYLPSIHTTITESLILIGSLLYETILHFNHLDIVNSTNSSCDFDTLSKISISDHEFVKNTTASANTR